MEWIWRSGILKQWFEGRNRRMRLVPSHWTDGEGWCCQTSAHQSGGDMQSDVESWHLLTLLTTEVLFHLVCTSRSRAVVIYFFSNKEGKTCVFQAINIRKIAFPQRLQTEFSMWFWASPLHSPGMFPSMVFFFVSKAWWNYYMDDKSIGQKS